MTSKRRRVENLSTFSPTNAYNLAKSPAIICRELPPSVSVVVDLGHSDNESLDDESEGSPPKSTPTQTLESSHQSIHLGDSHSTSPASASSDATSQPMQKSLTRWKSSCYRPARMPESKSKAPSRDHHQDFENYGNIDITSNSYSSDNSQSYDSSNHDSIQATTAFRRRKETTPPDGKDEHALFLAKAPKGRPKAVKTMLDIYSRQIEDMRSAKLPCCPTKEGDGLQAARKIRKGDWIAFMDVKAVPEYSDEHLQNARYAVSGLEPDFADKFSIDVLKKAGFISAEPGKELVLVPREPTKRESYAFIRTDNHIRLPHLMWLANEPSPGECVNARLETRVCQWAVGHGDSSELLLGPQIDLQAEDPDNLNLDCWRLSTIRVVVLLTAAKKIKKGDKILLDYGYSYRPWKTGDLSVKKKKKKRDKKN